MPLPPNSLGWDVMAFNTQLNNQLLSPPAQPTKNRAKAIAISPFIIHNYMLIIKKTAAIGPNSLALFEVVHQIRNLLGKVPEVR
jgi:hypothetical protein